MLPTDTSFQTSATTLGLKTPDPGDEGQHELSDPLPTSPTSPTSSTDWPMTSTFRYQSRSSIMSRSFRGYDMSKPFPQNADLATRRESDFEIESGSSSDRHGQSSPSDDDVPRSSASSSAVNKLKQHGALKEDMLLPTKTHPYSRRMIGSPQTAFPSKRRPQSRQGAYVPMDPNQECATVPAIRRNPAALKRRSTITSLPSNRRLLPATPVRRDIQPRKAAGTSKAGNRPIGAGNRNSIHVCETQGSDTRRESVSRKGSDVGVKSSHSKLVNSVQHEDNDKEEPIMMNTGSSLNSTPVGIITSVDSKADLQTTPKRKHTVQYKSGSNNSG